MKTTWGRLIWDQEVRENQNLCEFGITCTGTAPTWKDSTATDSLGLVEWLCWGQNLVILSGGNLVSCAWRSTARCRGGACRFDMFVLGIMMHIFSLMSASKVVCLVWARQILESIIARSILVIILYCKLSCRPTKKPLWSPQRTLVLFVFDVRTEKVESFQTREDMILPWMNYTMNHTWILRATSSSEGYPPSKWTKWTAEAATTTLAWWTCSASDCRQMLATCKGHGGHAFVEPNSLEVVDWISSPWFCHKSLGFSQAFSGAVRCRCRPGSLRVPQRRLVRKWWDRCRRCL